MADLTFWGIVIVVALGMILFGGRKFAAAIPEMSRNLGRAVGAFKTGRRQGEREFTEAVSAEPSAPAPPPPAIPSG
jgi:Sec-independent protein translocase protein TatA